MIPVMDLEAIDITYNQWMRACIQAEAQAVESEDVLDNGNILDLLSIPEFGCLETVENIWVG